MFEVGYVVRNSQNIIVFHATESVLLKDIYYSEKTLKTKLAFKPGVYTVSLEVDKDNITYVSRDSFEVREKMFIALPGVLLTARLVSDVLLRISLVLFIMFLVFLVLLFVEHRKSVRSLQINEKDLYKDGDIK